VDTSVQSEWNKLQMQNRSSFQVRIFCDTGFHRCAWFISYDTCCKTNMAIILLGKHYRKQMHMCEKMFIAYFIHYISCVLSA
jgi:hypothetical protein